MINKEIEIFFIAIIFISIVAFLFFSIKKSYTTKNVYNSNVYNSIGVLELIDKLENNNKNQNNSENDKKTQSYYYFSYSTESYNLSSCYISQYIYSNLVNKLDNKKLKYFSIDSYKDYNLNNKDNVVNFAKKNNIDLLIKGYVLQANFKAKVNEDKTKYYSDTIIHSAKCNIKLKICFIDNNGKNLVIFYPTYSVSYDEAKSSAMILDVHKNHIVQKALNSVFNQIYDKLSKYL
jgi:hypothetical protein